MSTNFPPLSPIVPINPPQIVPFTYRDGHTYIEILKSMRAYLESLTDSVNEQFASWNDSVNALIGQINDLVDSATDQINQGIADMNDLIAQAETLAEQVEQLAVTVSNDADSAATSASNAASSANAAAVSAQEAQDAANSIDQGAINNRFLAIESDVSDNQTAIVDINTTLEDVDDRFVLIDEVTKQLVDVSIAHKHKRHLGVDIDIFTIKTGGKHIPGLIERRVSDTPTPASLANFKTPRELSRIYGDSFVANGSGWDTVTGKIRGANIIDGVAHGVLATGGSTQERAAVAYCADGQLRYYEATLGDSVADMLADGAIHSWSWGPMLISNGALYNYTASGGWDGLAASTKSGRTVLAQDNDGNIVVAQAYGISSSRGLDVNEMAQALIGENLRIAVLLDGGGSTSSVWEGETAHPSSDSTPRALPDTISFNARKANDIAYPAATLPAVGGFTGNIEFSRVGSRVLVVGSLSGTRSTSGNVFITDPNTVPLWYKARRYNSTFNASGGKTGMVGSTDSYANGIRFGSGYSDGFTNPEFGYDVQIRD